MNRATAQSIREAIEHGDYAQALDLWKQYTAALAASGLTAESLAEAAHVVKWSRPLLLGAREHTAARLRALHVAGIYGGPAPKRSGLVQARL
ncbi:MAG TPA: hypothetical protein VMS37_14455 [Verrucomicrobiae bacterium]|nr:hypothetical protein [Verrucomicrobiae bacterium]